MFAVGILAGGYLFAKTQPRSFLSFQRCEKSCFSTNELLGLLASVGIQRFQHFIPRVVYETDKTIAIENPEPQAPIHYIIIPKKDIKNPATMTDLDKEYLVDAYATIQKLIRDKNLTKYKILTNGPGYQTVTYLHFHLIAPKQN